MALVVRFDPLLWYHDRFFIRCVCFWFSGEQAAPSEAVDVKKSKLKLADYISEYMWGDKGKRKFLNTFSALQKQNTYMY